MSSAIIKENLLGFALGLFCFMCQLMPDCSIIFWALLINVVQKVSVLPILNRFRLLFIQSRSKNVFRVETFC